MITTRIHHARRRQLGKESSAGACSILPSVCEELRAGEPLPATRNELGEASRSGAVVPSEGGARQRAKKGAVSPPGSTWSDGAPSRDPPHSERSQRESESGSQPRNPGQRKVSAHPPWESVLYLETQSVRGLPPSPEAKTTRVPGAWTCPTPPHLPPAPAQH